MARWVLPVLVGPSTATTLRPADGRAAPGLGETFMRTVRAQSFAVGPAAGGRRSLLYHSGTEARTKFRFRPNALNRWNESGTKPVRIADSRPVPAPFATTSGRVRRPTTCGHDMSSTVASRHALSRRDVAIADRRDAERRACGQLWIIVHEAHGRSVGGGAAARRASDGETRRADDQVADLGADQDAIGHQNGVSLDGHEPDFEPLVVGHVLHRRRGWCDGRRPERSGRRRR